MGNFWAIKMKDGSREKRKCMCNAQQAGSLERAFRIMVQVAERFGKGELAEDQLYEERERLANKAEAENSEEEEDDNDDDHGMAPPKMLEASGAKLEASSEDEED